VGCLPFIDGRGCANAGAGQRRATAPFPIATVATRHGRSTVGHRLRASHATQPVRTQYACNTYVRKLGWDGPWCKKKAGFPASVPGRAGSQSIVITITSPWWCFWKSVPSGEGGAPCVRRRGGRGGLGGALRLRAALLGSWAAALVVGPLLRASCNAVRT
jgi:hypothetical protein